uniref:phage tail protein n=1 Tax=Proteiniclasticum ruminis TaxID=398199 RepID=UPI00406BDAA0
GLVSAFPQIMDAGFKSLQALIDGILANLPQIIQMAISLIQTLAQGLMNNLPTIIKGGMDILLGLIDGIVQMLPDLITMAIDLVILIADNLIDNIDLLVDAGIEIIFALLDGIIQNLPKLIEEVPRIINKFADAIYAQFPKLLMAGLELLWEIGKGIIQAIPSLLANFPQIIMAIINIFTLANLVSVGKGFLKTFENGIKEGLKTLLTAAKGVATGVLDAIKGIFSGGAGSIGKNLVQGIWNGINSAKDWVLGKIKGFGSAIVGGIKSIFGIKSPSKVMEDEVGEMLPPGISRGVENAMPDLQDDVDREMEELTASMVQDVHLESARVGASLTSATSGRKNIETQVAAEEGQDVYVLEVTSTLDGREVGKGTAEFTSNELEKAKKRRK